MSRKITTIVLAVVFAASALTVSISASSAKQAQWEYQLIGMRKQDRSVVVGGEKMGLDNQMVGEFNYHGSKGWEFTGTIPGLDDVYFVVFRRRK